MLDAFSPVITFKLLLGCVLPVHSLCFDLIAQYAGYEPTVSQLTFSVFCAFQKCMQGGRVIVSYADCFIRDKSDRMFIHSQYTYIGTWN